MFYKLINSNSFLSNVLKVGTGSIIAQVLGYLFMPLITRLYTPDDFGELAVFMGVFAIISPLVGGKFEVALVLEKQIKNKNILYLLSCVVTLFISFITFIVFIFFGDEIVSIFNLSINTALLFLISILLLFFGFFQANRFYLVSNNYFGVISKMIVLEKTINTISKIFIGFIKPSGLGLIVSETISKTAGFFYTSLILFKNKLHVNLHNQFSLHEIKTLVKKYKKFPTFELMNDWFDSISNNVPILIFAYYFNNIYVGYYLFANSILKNVITLTSKNFSSVYYKKISETNEIDRKSFTSKLIATLSVIGFFPFMMISIGGPEIFSFIFGENWLIAGTYAQIFSPYLLILFFLKPINSLYRIYSKQDKLLYFNILNFIVFCLSVTIGGLMDDVFLTIILVSICGVFIYGWIYIWILQKMRINIFLIIKLTKKYFFISILFLFIPFLIKILSNDEMYFLFSLLISSIFYLMYILRFEYSKIKESF